VPDKKTTEQARYIFTTGKLLRRHIFSSLNRIEAGERSCPCPDLSMAQFNLLMAVQASGEITGGELATQLGVSPPSISVMVERLVERGLLIRQRSAEDRRKVVLRMSSEASLHFARIEEQVLASFVSLVEEVGEETAGKWVEVLQQVERVLQQRLACKPGGKDT
jgi:DNA-binding MarR family transcriptional regulator